MYPSVRSKFSFPNNCLIEVCAGSLEEAGQAESAGADQIEFCSHLELDGLTPAFPDVEKVFDLLSIPVKLMIRNRPGDFHYDPAEIRSMSRQIRSFVEFPVAGYVVGALDNELLPDLYALKTWAEAAEGIPLFFHKAIDHSADWEEALVRLAGIPEVKGILSSGMASSALAGIQTLSAMEAGFGKRFQIIAAGSITPEVVTQMAGSWQGNCYHGRRILAFPEGR